MFTFIGSLGRRELTVILMVVLLVFGPGKLTKAAEAVGKTALKSPGGTLWRNGDIGEVNIH